MLRWNTARESVIEQNIKLHPFSAVFAAAVTAVWIATATGSFSDTDTSRTGKLQQFLFDPRHRRLGLIRQPLKVPLAKRFAVFSFAAAAERTAANRNLRLKPHCCRGYRAGGDRSPPELDVRPRRQRADAYDDGPRHRDRQRYAAYRHKRTDGSLYLQRRRHRRAGDAVYSGVTLCVFRRIRIHAVAALPSCIDCHSMRSPGWSPATSGRRQRRTVRPRHSRS